MRIYKGTLGLIGNTPLVEVSNIEKYLGLEATVLVKLEYFNPAGSVTSSSEVQPPRALLVILLTFFGITRYVRDEQF